MVGSIVDGDIGLGFVASAERQIEIPCRLPVRLEKSCDLDLRIVDKRSSLIFCEGHGMSREIIRKTGERKRAAKIAVVDVTVQTVHELPPGFEAPSATRIHPDVTKLSRPIVVRALVRRGAAAERVEDVDREALSYWIKPAIIPPV